MDYRGKKILGFQTGTDEMVLDKTTGIYIPKVSSYTWSESKPSKETPGVDPVVYTTQTVPSKSKEEPKKKEKEEGPTAGEIVNLVLPEYKALKSLIDVRSTDDFFNAASDYTSDKSFQLYKAGEALYKNSPIRYMKPLAEFGGDMLYNKSFSSSYNKLTKGLLTEFANNPTTVSLGKTDKEKTVTNITGKALSGKAVIDNSKNKTKFSKKSFSSVNPKENYKITSAENLEYERYKKAVVDFAIDAGVNSKDVGEFREGFTKEVYEENKGDKEIILRSLGIDESLFDDKIPSLNNFINKYYDIKLFKVKNFPNATFTIDELNSINNSENPLETFNKNKSVKNIIDYSYAKDVFTNGSKEDIENFTVAEIASNPKMLATVLQTGSGMSPETISSLGLGLAGDFTNLYANATDPSVSSTRMWTELGLDLGMTGLAAVPTGAGNGPKFLKAAKVLKDNKLIKNLYKASDATTEYIKGSKFNKAMGFKPFAFAGDNSFARTNIYGMLKTAPVVLYGNNVIDINKALNKENKTLDDYEQIARFLSSTLIISKAALKNLSRASFDKTIKNLTKEGKSISTENFVKAYSKENNLSVLKGGNVKSKTEAFKGKLTPDFMRKYNYNTNAYKIKNPKGDYNVYGQDFKLVKDNTNTYPVASYVAPSKYKFRARTVSDNGDVNFHYTKKDLNYKTYFKSNKKIYFDEKGNYIPKENEFTYTIGPRVKVVGGTHGDIRAYERTAGLPKFESKWGSGVNGVQRNMFPKITLTNVKDNEEDKINNINSDNIINFDEYKYRLPSNQNETPSSTKFISVDNKKYKLKFYRNSSEGNFVYEEVSDFDNGVKPLKLSKIEFEETKRGGTDLMNILNDAYRKMHSTENGGNNMEGKKDGGEVGYIKAGQSGYNSEDFFNASEFMPKYNRIDAVYPFREGYESKDEILYSAAKGYDFVTRWDTYKDRTNSRDFFDIKNYGNNIKKENPFNLELKGSKGVYFPKVNNGEGESKVYLTKEANPFASDDNNNNKNKVVNQLLWAGANIASSAARKDSASLVAEGIRKAEKLKVTPENFTYNSLFIPAAQGLSYDQKKSMMDGLLRGIKPITQTSDLRFNTSIKNNFELQKNQVLSQVNATDSQAYDKSKSANLGMKMNENANINKINQLNVQQRNTSAEKNAAFKTKNIQEYYQALINDRAVRNKDLATGIGGAYDLFTGKQTQNQLGTGYVGSYNAPDYGKQMSDAYDKLDVNSDKYKSFKTYESIYKNAKTDEEKQDAYLNMYKILMSK